MTHNGTDSMDVFRASTLVNALICLMWVYMSKNVPVCAYANIKSRLRRILCFLKKMSVVILNSPECFERIAVVAKVFLVAFLCSLLCGSVF